MRFYLASILLLAASILTSACTGDATATPVPTATVEPSDTPVPTLPPVLSGPAPVTWQPIQVTPPPTATPDLPASASEPLVVGLTNLHYECQKNCWDRDDDTAFWTYRSFQLLMKVENVSEDLTLRGGRSESEGWAPTTWFITDGTNTRTDDYAWQYGWSQHDVWIRPDLPPGAEAEWTWLAVPLDHDEWVSGVEYIDEWGNSYRRDFEQPTHGAYNYVDCGAPLTGGPCYGRSR